MTTRLHILATFKAATGGPSAAASAAAGNSVALGYVTGSATTALNKDVSSCPATTAGVSTVFASANLGIDIGVGTLRTTLWSMKPVQNSITAWLAALDQSSRAIVGSVVQSNLEAIVILPNWKSPYFNVLGDGTTPGSTINMFSACAIFGTYARRMLLGGRALADPVYTYDDTGTYASSQAAGTGGTTDSSASTSSGLGTGAIVGIIVGALFGVALISVGVLVYMGKIEIPGINKRDSPVSGKSKKGAAVGGSNPMTQKKSFDAGGGF